MTALLSSQLRLVRPPIKVVIDPSIQLLSPTKQILWSRLFLGGTMKKMFIAGVVLCAMLSSCATTSEMPLAPNAVRLDTNASGLIFTSAAGAITMKKAAEATVKRGYTHFRLDQVATAQGSRFVGMNTNTYGNASANVYGNTAYGTYSANSFSTPMYAPTAQIGVTVIMFHANEAGAKGAFNAAEVIKKNGKI